MRVADTCVFGKIVTILWMFFAIVSCCECPQNVSRVCITFALYLCLSWAPTARGNGWQTGPAHSLSTTQVTDTSSDFTREQPRATSILAGTMCILIPKTHIYELIGGLVPTVRCASLMYVTTGIRRVQCWISIEPTRSSVGCRT